MGWEGLLLGHQGDDAEGACLVAELGAADGDVL